MHVAFERVLLQYFSKQPLEHCPPHWGGTHHTLLHDNPAPLRVPQVRGVMGLVALATGCVSASTSTILGGGVQ